MTDRLRKTRIIATMGPATRNPDTLRNMFESGVNIIRLNFSHGTHDEHAESIRLIRKVGEEMNVYPGILLDLQGPKIRTGEIADGGITLVEGGEITFTPKDIVGSEQRVSISYEHLSQDIKPGNRILLDDGLMDVVVDRIEEDDVICTVKTGGYLKPRKGVNLPNVDLSINPITEKDKKDLFFGIDSGVDYIALSFVRTSQEVIQLKKMIHEFGVRIPVIAKIEKQEAVQNIDDIIDAADGIMVARGDLAVETSPEHVPLTQKQIIEQCAITGKPVIIATQMLESMIENPRPTRAEASDVANAVFDGADAVMLSGETAIGKYPLQTVGMMDRIAREAEEVTFRPGHSRSYKLFELLSIPDAISHSIVSLADQVGAKFIVAFTFSGTTAKLLSKYRPSVPILAMTHSKTTIRQLTLYWGVDSVLVPQASNTDEIMDIAQKTLLDEGYAHPLDIVVISTGVPLSAAGTTNMVRVMQFPLKKPTTITGEHTTDKGRTFVWSIDCDNCLHCGVCAEVCSSNVFRITQKSADLNREHLQDCFFDLQCVYSCPGQAIKIRPKEEG